MDETGVFKGRRVFVTGHTGFKGARLTQWLLETGAAVTGFSLAPPSEPNLFDILRLKGRVDHVRGDIRNYAKLEAALRRARPDFIFHLAAQPIVRYSYDEPLLTYSTNVIGTANLLAAVRHAPSVGGCLVVTSDKCYENRERGRGFSETDPLGGHDPYSSSKACQELVTSAFHKSYFREGPAIASARAGNIIGGGDWGRDRLVPDCVRALHEGRPVALRNPSAIRPWQHVLEPLHGYLLLGAAMLREGPKFAGPWNFGPRRMKHLTVRELVEQAIKSWGGGRYTVEKGPFPHEARLLRLNSAKAHHLLGWSNIYSNRKAVQKTIGWYRDYYDKADDMYERTLREIREYGRDLGAKGR